MGGRLNAPKGFGKLLDGIDDFCMEQYLRIEPDLSKTYEASIYYQHGGTRRSFMFMHNGFSFSTDYKNEHVFGLRPDDTEKLAGILSKYPLSPKDVKIFDTRKNKETVSLSVRPSDLGEYTLAWGDDKPEWVDCLCEEMWDLANKMADDPERKRFDSFREIRYGFVKKPGTSPLSDDTMLLLKAASRMAGRRFPMESYEDYWWTYDLMHETW